MDEKIRAAYEEMGPTPEQEERMLKALQARAASTAAPAPAPASAPTPKRGGFKAWKVAVPLAACLAVGAIVIGITGNNATSPANQTPPAAVSASASTNTAKNSTPTEATGTGTARDAAAATSTSEVAEGNAMMATEEYDGTYAADAVELPAEPDTTDRFNTEEYAVIDENGFVSSATRPLSTISADVDTASYANLRRMIKSGYSLDEIPSGAVRVEEMLNYFTYDYDQPQGDELFSVQAQVSQCPWNPDTQLLVLGFATRQETAAAEKGANLVFLIDVSGSMDSSDKLPLLQDSFSTLLSHLDENDRVSIVTYSGEERIVIEGVSGSDQATILRAIYGLEASGSTNGEAGLRMAYEVANRNYIDGGVNRIIMASDGDLNVGMTSTSDLYDYVEEARESGVYLSVLGFGSGNYKDTKMEVLADHGNGSYHYIDCAEEAERVLSTNLMANLVPFADDVKVQVEFNPAQVKGYRLVGYENRALADEAFMDDTVDAGDVGPNAQFTVAYEIVPADSAYEIATPELKYGSAEYAGDASSDWLTCSLRYRAFADGEVHQQQIVVDASTATNSPDSNWKLAAAVIEFGMIASHSDYLGTATLDSAIELAEGISESPEVKELTKLMRILS